MAEATYDLLHYYEAAESIPSDEGTPDHLRLRPKENSGARPLFIEVEVHDAHHRPRTFQRDEPTLILHVESADDVTAIEAGNLSESRFTTQNFRLSPKRATDAECRCAARNMYLLLKYPSGKTYLGHGTLAEITERIPQSPRVDFFVCGEANPFSVREDMAAALAQLLRQGQVVRNCLACIHYQKPFGKEVPGMIFCQKFRKRCNWNQAVECSAFDMLPSFANEFSRSIAEPKQDEVQ